MADINRISSPGGPQEPQGKKDPTDPSKFKEEMQVSKVSETDPEQQKKRRQRAEKEEEPEEVGAPAPPSGVFSLEGPSMEQSPFALQSPDSTAAPILPGGPAAAPLGSDFQSSAVPFPDALPENQEAALSFPEESETTYSPSYPQTRPVSYPQQQAENSPRTTPTSQLNSPHPTARNTPLNSKKGAGPTALSSVSGKTKKKEDGVTTPALTPKDDEALPLFREPEQAEENKKAPSTPLNKTAPKEQEPLSEQEVEEIASATSLTAPGAATPMQETQPLTPTTLAPYTIMSAQMLAMVEKMVGVMTVMTLSGKTETSFILNSPQFASSRFFGTQIIIQEFASAPKEFNIQIHATPEAVDIFQANADDLMAAFQSGGYNFKVNRLETSLLTSKPLFSRKERVSREQDDQSGRGSS